MKTLITSVSTYRHNRSAAITAVITLLLAVTWSARAQYTYISGTSALNVYFTNTGAGMYPGEFNPTSDLPAGPCTPVGVAHLNPGAELSSPYFFSLVIPGALGGAGASYSSGPMLLGTASASVNYFTYPSLAGTNTAQSSATPYSGQINLTNTGAGIAELRLDWTAQFTYSGTTPIAPFAGAIMDVDLGTWVAVAGSLTFYDITAHTASSASISIGGDFPFPPGYPIALTAYSPSGAFWGLESPPSPAGLGSGIAGATGSPLFPASGDVIETVGFIDLLVDPGSVQLSIIPAPAPLVHSAKLSGTNLLVDVQNGVAGVSYVTCRSTSVSAPLSTWQPVATNIASSTGNFNFTATNAVNPGDSAAYYSIMVPH
jgi:hypothetical protein